MPPFVPLPAVLWPFALPHGWCLPPTFEWPGGGPHLVGHGGWSLSAFGGFTTTCVGRGVGLAVGLGVGWAVGRGVGLGVGCAVGRGVGAVVGRAVGAGVGAGVGVGGCAGRSVEVGVPTGVGVGWTVVGVPVAIGTSVGVAGARPLPVGVGVGLDDGEVIGPPEGALVPPGVPDAPVPPVDAGVGVGTTATGGGDGAVDRCDRPSPPAPSTIVASTRFRMPRLRTSRARWADVTSRSETPLRTGQGPADGTRRHPLRAIHRGRRVLLAHIGRGHRR